jgi:anti-anti-sigma factor
MMRKTLRSRRPHPDRPLPRWSLTHPAAAPLTWDIQSRGKLAVVATVEGELDVDTAPGLSEQLVPLAAAGRHLILNLAGVRFCDCAGLSLFLRLRKSVSASGGSLHLAAPTSPVRRLIAVARLSDVLPVTDDPAEVIAALNAAAAAGDPGS